MELKVGQLIHHSNLLNSAIFAAITIDNITGDIVTSLFNHHVFTPDIN